MRPSKPTMLWVPDHSHEYRGRVLVLTTNTIQRRGYRKSIVVSLLPLWALVASSGVNHIILNKTSFNTDIQLSKYLHHGNSETKLQKIDSILQNFVDTSTVDMLVYKKFVYEQTITILRIIISKIKRSLIHVFSYYLAFSRNPTTF